MSFIYESIGELEDLSSLLSVSFSVYLSTLFTVSTSLKKEGLIG